MNPILNAPGSADTRFPVGLDADGVLFNFDRSLAALAAKEWGIQLDSTPKAWNQAKEILGGKKWKALWTTHRLRQELFRLGPDFDPTFYMNRQMVEDLGKLDISLSVITARPTSVAVATAEAFNAAFGPFSFQKYTFLKDKTKAKPLPRFFLDDRLENAAELRSAGCEAYLLPYPYNQGAPKGWYTNAADFVRRVEEHLK